jgi:hypothetical protein
MEIIPVEALLKKSVKTFISYLVVSLSIALSLILFLLITAVVLKVTGITDYFGNQSLPFYFVVPITLIFYYLVFLSVIVFLSTLKEGTGISSLPTLYKKALKGWTGPIRFGIFYVAFTLIIGLGYFFLVIPGLIFTVWFIFSPYIFFEEKVSIFESLKRSKEYGRGLFWKLLLRIVGLLLTFLFISVLTILPILLNAFIGSDLLLYLSLGIWFIGTYFVMPVFFIIYFYLLYENIKSLKT